MKVIALIVAAGVGQRFHCELPHASASEESVENYGLPKQYHLLGGIPMLAISINALLQVTLIEEVGVVLNPEDAHFENRILPYLSMPHRVRAYRSGGRVRAESVLQGLKSQVSQDSINLETTWVLVHDAARPCVSSVAVSSMVKTLMNHAIGGLLATPVADTLKLGAPQDQAHHTDLLHTTSREQLWSAQTPQMFRVSMLMEALESARQSEAGLSSITDESMAIERWLSLYPEISDKPQLFRGPRDNIKVTYAEDLPLATAILKARSL